MRLIDRARAALKPSEARYGVDDYLGWVNQAWMSGGIGAPGMIQQTGTTREVEAADPSFTGFASASRANSVVFACMLSRMQTFSAVRFQWQQLSSNGPSKLFGTADLALLETPWRGGTTQDLLTRMIQDADLAGNSFWYRDGTDMVRLPPQYMAVGAVRRRDGGWRRTGYLLDDPDRGDLVWFPIESAQVVHFAPTPDPWAEFRGMSWLTPIIREMQTDTQMNVHKQAFFVNGATPNMVVSYDAAVKPETAERFIEMANREHQGAFNAYKTMHLGGGADVTVVGKDFKQVDLKAVQGHGETRIAAAAGVPPVIVGLSEGLAAATYSNYGQARRRFADGTIHPLWQNAAGSFAPLFGAPPPGVRLWYDARDVPFLREDELDAANIQAQQAATINTLISAGYTPESSAAAVMAGDFALLKHTGMVSVQLQKPGKPATENPIALDKELAT